MVPYQAHHGLQLIKDLVSGDNSIARICGFILFRKGDAQVIELLSNPIYWDALDYHSGDEWPIFAVRPLQQGQYKSRGGGGPASSISFICETWNEPVANIPILKEFELDESKKCPLFVVFTWDDKDNLKQFNVPIKGDSVNEVYNSLKEIIQTIKEAVEDVPAKDRQSIEVFNSVKKALVKSNIKCFVVERGPIVIGVAEFIIGLAGILL